MHKFTGLFLATTIILGATGFACAEIAPQSATQNGQMRGHHGLHGKHSMPGFEGIQLTDNQKAQISTLLKQERKTHPKPSTSQRQAIHQVIIADKFDSDVAESVAKQIAEDQQKHAVQRMETQNKIYHILTAEQQKQYNANVEKYIAEPAPGDMP